MAKLEIGTTVHGKNENGEFYQHRLNDCTILIQLNRLGIWHAYRSAKWLQSFTSQEDALHWFNERCNTQAKSTDPVVWVNT